MTSNETQIYTLPIFARSLCTDQSPNINFYFMHVQERALLDSIGVVFARSCLSGLSIHKSDPHTPKPLNVGMEGPATRFFVGFSIRMVWHPRYQKLEPY